MKFVRFALLPILALSFLGMAKKPKVSIRFHVEANARDGEPFMVPAKFHNPDRAGFVQRVPAISERDIVAVYPTRAQDGSFGCAFQLDRHGSIGLQTLSSEKRGFKIVPFIGTETGARQMVDLMIDKPITDGIIYIPFGLSETEITALLKEFSLIGAKSKKKG